jgi:DNA polymerase I-like protein with 3'-5' exonuclease and polymerase domains
MVLSVDIETTGLDWRRDRITCIGAFSENLRIKRVFRGESMIKDLADLLQSVPEATIVGQNFGFDLKFLVKAGMPEELLYSRWANDTQILAHVLSAAVPDSWLEAYNARRLEENAALPKGVAHRQAGGLSLKTMAPYYLGVDPFWETPGNHDNDEYVLKDVEYTYRLFRFFEEKLDEESDKFYRQSMMPWAKMLVKMEMTGVSLDLAELDQMRTDLSTQEKNLERDLRELWRKPIKELRSDALQELRQKYEEMSNKALAKAKDASKVDARYSALFEAAAGKLPEFNLSSPTQMKQLLGEKLGYDLTTLAGEESTSKAVLKTLSAEKPDLKKYLDWRDVQKTLTMYLPTYEEAQVDGIITTNFHLTGTRTGRLSSSNINCQQIPSKLFKLFKPRPGHAFIKYDLSSIEAVLIALYSEDETLYNLLASGGSLHNHNAKVFFDLDCEIGEVPEKYPKHRQTAKTVGFSLFYGAGVNRIRTAFKQAGWPVSEAEAKVIRDNFKRSFPGATAFHKEITREFEAGVTIPNLFGRPIKVSPEDAYMKGFNTLIQSSASDLTLTSCLDAVNKWEAAGLKAKPLFLIHDAILAESPIDEAQAAAEILKTSMTTYNLKNSLGGFSLGVDGGVYSEWQK